MSYRADAIALVLCLIVCLVMAAVWDVGAIYLTGAALFVWGMNLIMPDVIKWMPIRAILGVWVILFGGIIGLVAGHGQHWWFAFVVGVAVGRALYGLIRPDVWWRQNKHPDIRL